MQNSNVRPAAAAGRFYNGSKDALRKQIEGLIVRNAPKEDAIACVLPHAGYQYSGPVAGETVCRINLKDKIILLGPNHTGMGSEFSISTQGCWETPLGQVKIDSALAKAILKESKFLKEDTLAHLGEHSLEVELPFLQYFRDNFEIVPIVFMSDDCEALKDIGTAIAGAVKKMGIEDSTLIIASSDMTHYEPQAQAEKKDREAIRAILELNEGLLVKKVKQLNISMCGCAPTAAMLEAAKGLGAKHAKLIKYQTSGDTTGDKESVVGYAGITIF